MLTFVPGYGDNANFNPLLVTRVIKRYGQHSIPKKRLRSFWGYEYYNIYYDKKKRRYLRYTSAHTLGDPWPMKFLKPEVVIHSGGQKLVLECNSNMQAESLFAWIIGVIVTRGNQNFLDNVRSIV